MLHACGRVEFLSRDVDGVQEAGYSVFDGTNRMEGWGAPFFQFCLQPFRCWCRGLAFSCATESIKESEAHALMLNYSGIGDFLFMSCTSYSFSTDIGLSR